MSGLAGNLTTKGVIFPEWPTLTAQWSQKPYCQMLQVSLQPNRKGSVTLVVDLTRELS